MAILKFKNANGEWEVAETPGAVKYTEEQNLTEAEKALVKRNLDIGDGTDGVSATHTWNGTILTVTSASGTSSADLKGDPGYSPARGTDYWTDADKAEIKSYVDDAILNGAW